MQRNPETGLPGNGMPQWARDIQEETKRQQQAVVESCIDEQVALWRGLAHEYAGKAGRWQAIAAVGLPVAYVLGAWLGWP